MPAAWSHMQVGRQAGQRRPKAAMNTFDISKRQSEAAESAASVRVPTLGDDILPCPLSEARSDPDAAVQTGLAGPISAAIEHKAVGGCTDLRNAGKALQGARDNFNQRRDVIDVGSCAAAIHIRAHKIEGIGGEMEHVQASACIRAREGTREVRGW